LSHTLLRFAANERQIGKCLPADGINAANDINWDRHVPLGSSANKLPQSMSSAKEDDGH
jgi:hypothetical protein